MGLMSTAIWIAVDFGIIVSPAEAPSEPMVEPAVVMEAAPAPEPVYGYGEFICVGPEGSLDNPLTPEYEPGRAVMRYYGTEPRVWESPYCELQR